MILLLLILLSLRTQRLENFERAFYAHRGLYGNGIPENSLAAFSCAVKRGFGAELDVRLTSDGELVVFHDAELLRMTGEYGAVEGLCTDRRKALRLKGSEEGIPLLSEVLSLFKGGLPLLIELKTAKGNYAELTRRVCELTDRFPGLECCVESFDPRVLRWLKKHRPDIVRVQLTYRSCLNLMLNFWTKPHVIACKFEARNTLAMRICRRLWKARIIYWTIADPAAARIAQKHGAQIIFEEELCTIS